uniref:entry exclusion lipoprotein TrbK n=1 Tax=Acidovorax sp. SUPP3334 TaxID=2920881 RepID=UPI002952936E|nr:entry exclusion lipoprotein TrbK [Acidovorax sp. SUPP3334]BDH38419.1 entry exclusion lipoprotein TrbK [Acidovorax sp. SUPP3334]
MKTNKVLTLALAALVAALVAGCGEKPAEPAKQALPEVSDENCKPASVAKIEDKGAQQAFSSLCLRRGGGFKPSEKKEW